MGSWFGKALKLFVKYGPLTWEAIKIGRKIVREYRANKKMPIQTIEEHREKQQKKKTTSAHSQ